MEEQIRKGQQWLERLLELMGMSAPVKVETFKDETTEKNNYWLLIDDAQLTPAQKELLIGQGGEMIDAVQYLANTLLNIGLEREDQQPFTVELDGYRMRRQAELKNLAAQVAQRVRETGIPAEMRSLSSAERRQIHNFFQAFEDLETESRGQEPDRRLVVRLR